MIALSKSTYNGIIQIVTNQDLPAKNMFNRLKPCSNGHCILNFVSMICHILLMLLFSSISVEKRKALKRKSTQDIEELTQKNLLLDNEMLIEQKKMYVKKQEKYNIEIQKMKLEIEYWALKKELLVLQI